jgi:hypothetical protein
VGGVSVARKSTQEILAMARSGSAFLFAFLVLAGVVATTGQTSRRSSPKYHKPQTTEETLFTAMQSGHVSVQVRSTGASSGDSILLTIAKTEAAPAGTLSITVSPGTPFVNTSGTGQSMVVSGVHGRAIDEHRYFRGSEILLSDAAPYTYILTSYCAEFHKDNPSPLSRFAVGRADSTLACILSEAQRQGLDIQATQDAVWIYTDHVDYRTISSKFRISESDWAAASVVARSCLLSGPSSPGARVPSDNTRQQYSGDLSGIPGLQNKAASGDLQQQLTRAVGEGQTDMVLQLLRQGADVNLAPPNGLTPLVSAIASHKPEMVELLLANGANPNLKDSLGNPPLESAVAMGGNQMVRLLLSKNADVNARNRLGDTPLITSVIASHPDLDSVTMLLNAGAIANVTGFMQFTALMWASQNGYTDVVRVLIARGADVNFRTSQGPSQSALALAKQKGNKEVVAILKSAGARN